MANTYHLLCMDCRRYLSLGKVHWISAAGVSHEEVRVQGVYDGQRKAWAARDEFFGRAIEGFLLRHRNHELRFVPEGVDELLDTDESAVQPVAAEEVVSPLPREIDVDAGRELEAWKRRIGG